MKINKMKLRIEERSGGVLLDKKLLSLPLKDHSIVSLSIDLFNDPEPCMIHRSAIMKRMFSEMYEWLMDHKDNSRIPWETMPRHMRDWVELEDREAVSVHVY